MCVSIWITERECFPIALMYWIQIPNNFCFWLTERLSNIKQYVFLLCEPSFCHCCKVGWELVSGVCEHMNYWKRVFSNCFDVLNPNIKSFLLLVEWKMIKHKTICVFVMWTIILSCCKVGWELVSDMWEHMNYWKRVFFNCVDLVNLIIKSFLLLVEWKNIKHKTICVFVTWTIILSLLWSWKARSQKQRMT